VTGWSARGSRASPRPRPPDFVPGKRLPRPERDPSRLGSRSGPSPPSRAGLRIFARSRFDTLGNRKPDRTNEGSGSISRRTGRSPGAEIRRNANGLDPNEPGRSILGEQANPRSQASPGEAMGFRESGKYADSWHARRYCSCRFAVRRAQAQRVLGANPHGSLRSPSRPAGRSPLLGARRGNGTACEGDDASAGERESWTARPRRKLEIAPGRD
jgi:hypothetical protein